MAWWKKSIIPDKNSNFNLIIKGLLFECPSSIRQERNDKKMPNGKWRKKTIYSDVSARGCSFKSRNITGNLLITILAQIRRPLVKSGVYAALKTDESIENMVNSMISNSSMKDDNFELMVFHMRGDMPDSEAIFYYIRNAFAHGSFEIIDGENPTYILESQKNGTVKARMRIKESTLLEYVDLVQKKPSEIRAMQKKKTK